MSCTRTTYTFNVVGDNLPDLQARAGAHVREFFGHDKSYELSVEQAPESRLYSFKYIAAVYVAS